MYNNNKNKNNNKYYFFRWQPREDSQRFRNHQRRS